MRSTCADANKSFRAALALALSLFGCFALIAFASTPHVAWAEESAWEEELEEVRAEIDDKLAEAEQAAADLEEAQLNIQELEERLDTLLDDIEFQQKKQVELQNTAADMAKTMYKNRSDLNVISLLDGIESFTDAEQRMDMRSRVLSDYNDLLAQVNEAQRQLEQDYARASADKDSQVRLQKQIVEKQAELEEALEELRDREEALDVEQKAHLAELAAAEGRIAETFETGTLAEIEGVEWKTGEASAYGGSTDDMTPEDQPTATGDEVDDFSMGVAVPIAWKPEKYYGKKVEISYEGRSIIATVNDCGGLNGGKRALDLQPGVFRAFGATDCDDWGVREVRFRFL